MIKYHPWRDLRDRPEVALYWTSLPAGVLAVSDGERIWMERRQRQAQRRSTLAHELEHIDRGHDGCQRPSVEAEVEAAAARKLIPLQALAEAVVWSLDEHELAGDLWVDVEMVRARLRHLSDDERAYIDDVIGRREVAL